MPNEQATISEQGDSGGMVAKLYATRADRRPRARAPAGSCATRAPAGSDFRWGGRHPTPRICPAWAGPGSGLGWTIGTADGLTYERFSLRWQDFSATRHHISATRRCVHGRPDTRTLDSYTLEVQSCCNHTSDTGFLGLVLTQCPTYEMRQELRSSRLPRQQTEPQAPQRPAHDRPLEWKIAKRLSKRRSLSE